jgi:broad specificity phosphatase PhoE
MTRLFTVQTGQTVWEEQSRFDSLAGVPLSDSGREVIRRVAKELVPHEPTGLYASPGEAEQETANLLAKELDLKVRTEKQMVEIDFGLWQGLTMNEIRRRQPRLHKQWLEAPSGVRPPGGESLSEAGDRIREAVREILRREKKQAPVLVLRPVVLGVLRCCFEEAQLDDIWKHASRDFTWKSYQVDEKDF